MDIALAARLPARSRNALLVVAAFDDKLSEHAAELDALGDGALSRARQRGDVSNLPGQHVTLHEVPGVACERIMIISAGQKSVQNERDYRRLCQQVAIAALACPARQAVVCLAQEIEVSDRDEAWRIRQLAQALASAGYRFDTHKSQVPKPQPSPSKIALLASSTTRKDLKKAVSRAQATAAGMSLTRDLGNTAPNVCTPEYLADTARQLAVAHSALKTRVLDETRLKKLGMSAFLSVAQGSRQPPRLISMDYQGGKRGSAPCVLVGKGVTFDTGGISIKPSASLDEMKFDMCGAATVFGVMQAVCELKLPINLIGVVAAAENMPDGNASRPGDVVTSLSGKTIEILNTDAEGRMLLADALTWVKRFKPETVIDMATLTGSAVIALGQVNSALFSNDASLADALMEAGQHAGDPAWQLPMGDEYQSQLDSPFADMANIGGRAAGAVTAACFLSRFVDDYAWAHLDIAGTASGSGADKGATGRPVPLLMEYLCTRVDHA